MVGAADELQQYYIPERTASFADIIGIILVIIVLNYTQRKSAALSSKS